jgi:hypothetical protein
MSTADIDHIWQAVTTSTFASATVVGVFLAVFLWHTFSHVTLECLFAVWISGAVFFVVIGAGRLVDGTTLWEVYLGLAVLWTWYVTVAGVAIWAYRIVRRR